MDVPLPTSYAASLPHCTLTACHLNIAGLPLRCRPTSSVVIIVIVFIIIFFIVIIFIIVIVYPLSLWSFYVSLFCDWAFFLTRLFSFCYF
jgi:hypothetical protein